MNTTSNNLPTTKDDPGSRVATTGAVKKSMSAAAAAAQLEASNRSSPQKAAAVLALLDDKTLEKLSGRLPAHHRDRLMESVRTMRSVPVKEQKRIAREFAQRLADEKNAIRGTEEQAQRLKTALFQEEEEFEQLEFMSVLPEETVWDKVSQLPMPRLISFFESKPPTVLSVALRQLPEDVASEIASTISETHVKDGVVQIATTGNMNPVALEAVEALIEKSLFSEDDDDIPTDDGNSRVSNADKVATLLNRMTATRRNMVLDALQADLSAEELQEIEDKVLSFEALEHRLPRNAVPIIFREMEDDDILRAMKYSLGLEMPAADYLMRNISQRMAAQYQETMDAMPNLDTEEGEKAQSLVICKVLELSDQGRVTLLAGE